MIAYGTDAECARAFGVDDDLAVRVIVACREAQKRGDPIPGPRRLGDRVVEHAGRTVRAIVTVGELPPWLLELDDDLQPRTFRAAAESPHTTGLLLVGMGNSLDEALNRLRGALDADRRLVPKGVG